MATNDRHAELVDRLTDGIADLTSSDRWRRYLDFQARFHRYSAGNVLLVLAQRPDASRVAGFRAWLALGRAVRRGEHAIWILAPMVRPRPGDDPDDEPRAADSSGCRCSTCPRPRGRSFPRSADRSLATTGPPTSPGSSRSPD